MIISIHDIGGNGRGARYELLRANVGGEIYSPELDYGNCSPLSTFERPTRAATCTKRCRRRAGMSG